MLMSKCDICSEKDHDGFFCRCESRNIEVAKELRIQGKSPWKRSQEPHAKMTEEQLKEAVCKIVFDMQELRETCIERHNMIAEQIDEIDMQLYWLKRHFCPEKFESVQVPMSTISDLIMDTYGKIDLSGDVQKLQRYADDPTT